MNCPKCTSEMRWVDNGDKFQYYYCGSCKKELAEMQSKSATDDFLDAVRYMQGGFEEGHNIVINLPYSYEVRAEYMSNKEFLERFEKMCSKNKEIIWTF